MKKDLLKFPFKRTFFSTVIFVLCLSFSTHATTMEKDE